MAKMMPILNDAQQECIYRMLDKNEYGDCLEYIKEICYIQSDKEAFNIMNSIIQERP